MKNFFLLFAFILIIIGVAASFILKNPGTIPSSSNNTAVAQPISNPLSINYMKVKSYPGSNITIKQTLPDGSNYHQFIASYLSDGLKLNALLTVPIGQKPSGGWLLSFLTTAIFPLISIQRKTATK